MKQNIKIIEHGVDDKQPLLLYPCPECKLKAAYYRVRTNDYVCRNCRCIFQILKDVPE